MNPRETLNTLVAEAGRGGLAFPTSVKVMLRVQQAIDDPRSSADTIADQIRVEPLLSARVIALANSAAYNRANRPVTDVRTAVNMLGLRAVKVVATIMITKLLAAESLLPAHRETAAKLWEHSAHVGALAQLLAKRVTKVDAETAMFAGMLHEIGGFYLLYRASQLPGLLESDAMDWVGSDDDAVEHTPERDIGRALFKSLAVPAPIVEAIEILWRGYLAFPPTTMGDTLLLAYELSPVKSPLRETIVRTDGDVAARIDMMVGSETLADILIQSATEVAAMVRTLKG